MFVPGLFAQQKTAEPRITGMAHMAYHVTDLKKARDYYEGFLRFQEAFTIKNADGTDHIVFIKINDRQYIELYAEPFQNYGYIHDAGFETNDAKGMRDHLASIGVKVPDAVTKDETGNLSFSILDPSGFTLQIVQYLPNSMTGETKGKFMPAARISDHIDAEIDTVSKGGNGLQAGGGKGGKAKKEEAPVDPFQAEESLSDALLKYAAFSDAEKKALVLKVKTASRRPDAPAMTPEQAKAIDLQIEKLLS